MDKSVFKFLKNLQHHNNREWFIKNKPLYETARKNLAKFIDLVIIEMNQFDSLETPNGSRSLQRIYRDLRFSSDKSPYKSYMAGRLKRAGRERRGGYYFHFEPGKTYLAGGFYGPEAEDLKRIRMEFAADHETIRKILKDKGFIKYFGTIQGQKLKSAPRGFSAELPGIELIKMKQLILKRKFSDHEVFSGEFFYQMIETYRQMRPFFDYMTWILTTDVNGSPLL